MPLTLTSPVGTETFDHVSPEFVVARMNAPEFSEPVT